MPYCMQQKISRFLTKGYRPQPTTGKRLAHRTPPRRSVKAFTADAAARYAAANGPDVAAVKKEKLLVVQGRPAAAEEI